MRVMRWEMLIDLTLPTVHLVCFPPVSGGRTDWPALQYCQHRNTRALDQAGALKLGRIILKQFIRFNQPSPSPWLTLCLATVITYFSWGKSGRKLFPEFLSKRSRAVVGFCLRWLSVDADIYKIETIRSHLLHVPRLLWSIFPSSVSDNKWLPDRTCQNIIMKL